MNFKEVRELLIGTGRASGRISELVVSCRRVLVSLG